MIYDTTPFNSKPPDYGFAPGEVGDRGQPQDSQNIERTLPLYTKPFSFALDTGVGGARCYFGQLTTSVTILKFIRHTVEGGHVNVLDTQPPAPKVTTHNPFADFDVDPRQLKAIDLGWWGDVYLYWEVDTVSGDITACDVRGADGEPDSVPIPELDDQLHRPDPTTGKYWVKIGSVSNSGDIVQELSSDITWAITLVPAVGGDPGSMTHPWRVSNTDPGEWLVQIDNVYGQGGPVAPSSPTVSLSSGFIYLKISRDAGSREMTEVTLETGGSIPASDQYDQYRAIAQIIDDTNWIQIQYEEIRIEELMIVANGQFALAPMEMSSRNTYDPPT